jgi:hypothetical protein
MWALLVDGQVELVRKALPGFVLSSPSVGEPPVEVAYSLEDAAADGWVEVVLSESPGEGFDPLLVVDGDTVTQTWVET